MSYFMPGQHIFMPLMFSTVHLNNAVNKRDFAWDIRMTVQRPWQDGNLWFTARMMAGDPTMPLAPFGQTDPNTGNLWSCPDFEEGGGQQALKITGITRDNAGAILGSCLVDCFRTSDDIRVGSVVSDTAGYFTLYAPDASSIQHYLVAYKAGSPDVAGVTVNTLTLG